MSSNNDHFITTTTTASNAMEKHVRFWDRKNKGYITPVDTVFGFINLGYGLVISITIGTFIGILFSYSTQDSWMPDVLFRTRTEKLQEGTRKEPYNSIGQLDLEQFEELFSKHAKADISGKTITMKELLEWNEATYKEPLNWSATALEWVAIYLLVGSKGVVKKEDIQAAYDGTLFYQVRDRNKHHHRTMIIQDASSAADNNNNNNLLNVSGVKVSKKSYIRQLESQVGHVLPLTTVSLLETRLRHWLSFIQQQQQQDEQQQQNGQPILKGVPTPMPTRRPLFAIDHVNDDEMDTTHRSSPLFDGGLTGVMGINLLDQAVPLTGVQKDEQEHAAAADDDEQDNGNGVDLCGLMKDGEGTTTSDYGNDMTSSMTGVRSENEDGDNWLHTKQLTGVSPSTSTTTSLAKTIQEQQQVCEDNEDGDNWLHTKQLTGVSPSTSTTTSLAKTIQEQQQQQVCEDNEDGGNWLHTKHLTGVSPSTSTTTSLEKTIQEQQQQQVCEDHDDVDNRPLDIPNGSTPPLTETSSVTSDMDGSDDLSSKDHEEELNNNTTMNVTSSKKKNKKNKKKKKQQQRLQQQQQQEQQAPTPPAKDNDDDELISPSDMTDHQQIKHTTTTSFHHHHHSAWPSVTDSVPADN